jgi:iron(III) transport system substrate-binding protein
LRRRRKPATPAEVGRTPWSRAGFLLAMAASGWGAGCRVEFGAPANTPLAEASGAPRGKVTIYTSMYREVIDQVDPLLEAALPEVEVEWLQAGSEKIATRLDAELSAGATPCDLVLTSDPLWYERQARAGHLLPYASLRALALDRRFVRRDGAYVTSRISTMVIAYDQKKVPADRAPRTFAALFEDPWRGRVTLPDPLGSGTTFTSLAVLLGRDPSMLARIRGAQVMASGGNSSTLTRIESGEQQVGMVLLENVLEAQARGGAIGLVVPEDGPVVVPGPIAILRLSPNPHGARAVYDLLLSEPVQRELIKGRLHSPFEELPAPTGAPSIQVVLASPYQVDAAFLEQALSRDEVLREELAHLRPTP